MILPGVATIIFRTFPCIDVDPEVCLSDVRRKNFVDKRIRSVIQQQDTHVGKDVYMTADLGISCSSERYKLGTSWAALMIIVSALYICANFKL